MCWNSDIVLAVFLPLAVVLVGFRFSPFTVHDLRELLTLPLPKNQNGPYSLNTALQSYARYADLSKNELSCMRASYSTLGRAHKRLANKLGYTSKLDRLNEAIGLNAKVTNAIADFARKEFNIGHIIRGTENVGRVRESLKHFVRDWSEDGNGEREKIFAPILDVLKEVHGKERARKKVLVPGSGLGRLSWEISQLGFDTTANEWSYFMTLAFRFLLSPITTLSPHQHTLHPYSHWFSHQRANDNTFRPITFPDIVPRLSPNFRLVEGDFLSIPIPRRTTPNSLRLETQNISKPPSAPEGYDYIITLFFIDTSLNVIETIQHIYALLKPGGSWINLGPLLWTGEAQTKVELSLQEVLRLTEEVGFILEGRHLEVDGQSDFRNGNGTAAEEWLMKGDEKRRRKTVQCEYTADNKAMMTWIYHAEFWVARKWK